MASKDPPPKYPISVLSPNPANRMKFNKWSHQNPDEWYRPREPGDTVHQKEDVDASDQYARGGPVLPRAPINTDHTTLFKRR